MATITGNFVNASPIGDLTVFFLVLNTKLSLTDGYHRREMDLEDFYKGYKKLDKKAEEYIDQFSFDMPDEDTRFNFEKVSKRTNLDIASVNSACCLKMNGNRISEASISAGGVGPVPMLLKRTSAMLANKVIHEAIVEEVCMMAAEEISPISDARGTSEYKTFLLQQLIRAHFITLFPTLNIEKVLAV
jgi:xanthine dehydrogenase small subunit